MNALALSSLDKLFIDQDDFTERVRTSPHARFFLRECKGIVKKEQIMYSFFIFPCFMIFFIIYGLNAKKEGKRVYRLGPVFFVFCFSVIVSAFAFSIVNQALDMEWVQSPQDFFKNQLVFALGPFIGFALSTAVRGDWKKEDTKKEAKIGKQAAQKQPAKTPMPASRVALLSGISSSLGYLPHLGFLLAIFFLKGPHNLQFLIPTYLVLCIKSY